MNIIKSLVTKGHAYFSRGNDSMRIFLHVGSPKAGSSALQNFMLDSRKSLEKLGYYYPKHSIDKNGVSGGHGQLGSALREGDNETAESLINEWLTHARKNGKKLVLSSESFFSQAEALQTLLHERMQLAPDNIRVIAFVRAPVDYLMGNLNQGIKRHGETRRLINHLAPVLRNGKSNLTGAPLIQWADAFGDDNCRFLTYQKPADDVPQIESVFLNELGVPASEIPALLPERKITNRSYVRSALELKRTLNTVLSMLPLEVEREIDWALQEYSDQYPREGSLGSRDIPEPLYKEINDMFLTAMEPVMQRFPMLDPDVLFSPQEPKVAKTVDLSNPYRPLAYLEVHCAKELEAVKVEAWSQYRQGRQGYTFLKLLDLLGLDFEEPIAHTGLSARARGIIANSKMEEADRLRELGAYFEQHGLLDDALLLLEKALDHRPSGPNIQRLRHRVVAKKSVLEQINIPDTD